MIYKNNKTINEWYFNDAELIKVYKNGAICYYKIVQGATPHQEPCFAVVEDITQYTDTEFVDVYDKATDKWYKLNNLGQYEEYGVYGEGRNITYYEGKLTIDNGYEYEWDGSEWDNLGEVTGSTRVPQGYTEVEYVGSNGNAYINTGLQLMDTVGNTFSIEGRVWTEYYVTDDGFGYLMSTESTTRPYPGFTWRWNQHHNSVLEFGGETGSNAILSTVDKGDGTSGFTVSSNGTSLTNNNTPFSLFAGLNGTSPWRFSKSKYYNELKITKNNQVVADYIPCQRDSDSKYGFYDLVSDSFKSSSNSNSLIGGGTGGAKEYPKYYTTKDEPENNVVFIDMEDALAYECPWVGMDATIDNTPYLFGDAYEWLTKYGLFEVSGEYICYRGDKYEKMEEMVRNVDGTWLHQTPIVYEKGDLIEAGSTDCDSRLPDGYTEVEYIRQPSSSLHQNVNNKWTIPTTNMVNGDSFTIIFSMDSENQENVSKYISIFGSEEVFAIRNDGGYGYNLNTKYFTNANTERGNYTMEYDTKLSFNYKPSLLTVTNATTGVQTLVNLTQSSGYNPSGNLGVFGFWYGGTGEYLMCGNIYEIKIEGSDDTLKYDYIPCKRDSDNKVGLYDIVNGLFTSPSGFTITAGPEVF
ncbi:hypothetical protein [Methanobrevibacter sp.]|uniref:hypothetical protein n=1 Tax=Methanobrevibacter sp. TaxID=66852 RepID=UPI003864E5E0